MWEENIVPSHIPSFIIQVSGFPVNTCLLMNLVNRDPGIFVWTPSARWLCKRSLFRKGEVYGSELMLDRVHYSRGVLFNIIPVVKKENL